LIVLPLRRCRNYRPAKAAHQASDGVGLGQNGLPQIRKPGMPTCAALALGRLFHLGVRLPLFGLRTRSRRNLKMESVLESCRLEHQVSCRLEDCQLPFLFRPHRTKCLCGLLPTGRFRFWLGHGKSSRRQAIQHDFGCMVQRCQTTCEPESADFRTEIDVGRFARSESTLPQSLGWRA